MTRAQDTFEQVANATQALAGGTAQVIGGTAQVLGGTAQLAGHTAQALAPAGKALGALTTETVGLTATTVGITHDFGKEARRIVRAPLDVIASATELVCTPVTRSLRTATHAINAGFDKIDRKFGPAVLAAG